MNTTNATIVYTIQPGSVETVMHTAHAIQCAQEIHYYVGADAHVHYSLVIAEQGLISAIKLRFFLARNAQLTADLLCAYDTMRIDIEIVLQQEGAQAVVRGAYVLNQAHAIEIQTVQHHQAAHTKSELIMRSAIKDNGFATYRGIIRVDQSARGSVSSQENKNILLSNAARALSVPSLEVLTNDVRCFHGSATGRFDQDQLVYAASRGIDEKVARYLLLNAFFANLFISKTMQYELGQLLDRLYIKK